MNGFSFPEIEREVSTDWFNWVNGYYAETATLDFENFPVQSSFVVRQGDLFEHLLSALALSKFTTHVSAQTFSRPNVRYCKDDVYWSHESSTIFWITKSDFLSIWKSAVNLTHLMPISQRSQNGDCPKPVISCSAVELVKTCSNNWKYYFVLIQWRHLFGALKSYKSFPLSFYFVEVPKLLQV